MLFPRILVEEFLVHSRTYINIGILKSVMRDTSVCRFSENEAGKRKTPIAASISLSRSFDSSNIFKLSEALEKL
jgi:hypothetical protein